MATIQNVCSQEELREKIFAIFGESLEKRDLEGCLKSLEVIEAEATKLFWQATEAQPGIYVVLEGRIRILDNSDNLIATVSSGAAFGEQSLFKEQNFLFLAAKASTSVKLCFIRGAILSDLMGKNPQIRDILYKRAEFWDLLLLCRQNSQIPSNISLEQMFKALFLFERYQIKPGENISELHSNSKILLLQQGELRSERGETFLPGKIYTNLTEKLQVIQPSVVYRLNNADSNAALEQCPQLDRWSDPSEASPSTESRNNSNSWVKPSGINSERKVIPFPAKVKEEKEKRVLFPSPKVKAKQFWQSFTKSYPFFAQQSGSDCGAACLVMIARHWGQHLSANRVREIANVNREGASLRSLAAAAESVGFASRPVKATLDKLAQQTLPAVAHWEGKHYIVVYEITPQKVIVCDPAIGQRSFSHSEFKAKWTGYALLLQPTVKLKDNEGKSTGLWKYLELVKPHWKILLEIFIASLVIQVFGLITPLFTQLLLDKVIVQGSIVTLNADSISSM
ncbi:MAG: cysteine peptidase family C39 domain-containing protein [Cyanobacteria bacterium J06632_19]